MFITVPKDENIVKEELISLYSSKFTDSLDIVNCKRNIIIHNNLDMRRSQYEGFHTVKCTIINKAVLNGKFNHDTQTNPDQLLVKTIYNGYITWPPDAIVKEFKLSEDLLSKGIFRINNAYTSYMGIWDREFVNINNNGFTRCGADFEGFSPIGVSILDMIDLRNATLNTRNIVSIYGCEIAFKVEISFDGDRYETILPIPLPYFYSRLHAEINNEDPVIIRNEKICIEDICDKNTKVSLINFSNSKPDMELDYKFDSDITSQLSYLQEDGTHIITNDNSKDMPMKVACSLIRSLSDDLYTKFFKIFSRYQLASLDFIYDSERDFLSIPSMRFSYDTVPYKFAETVLIDIYDCKDLKDDVLSRFQLVYGPIELIGRITDLKFDLTIKFKYGHKDVKRLKSVKYRTSIFDIMNSITDFETSINNPISSL